VKTARASVLGFGLGVIFLLLLGSVGRAHPPGIPSQLTATQDHTFSIVAFDPETGEVGVAVTTRNPCVGNRVPWVRAGVGGIATQASTRPEYGREVLDLLEGGATPQEALNAALDGDEGSDRRQVGGVGATGGTAQHTGSGPGPWAGELAGQNFATQGNVLAGPQVLEAVAEVMRETEGSGRALSDRLVAALEAGHAAGGDKRKGRRQSAAVVIADPRPGESVRPDGRSVFLHICEHPEPVQELRRQYESVSQTLGYRTLQRYSGSDVWQLKVILHALGDFRPGEDALSRDGEWGDFSGELALAVDDFRARAGLSVTDDGTPSGFVDGETVKELWAVLAKAGKAREVRTQLRSVTRIRN
jgi:uncharacterized Ntn-hydrolase superfamily protein